MPAVQVDVGYVSNDEERDRLTREDFRNTVADGILVAVKRLYLDGHDDRPPAPSPSATSSTTSGPPAAHERVHGVADARR